MLIPITREWRYGVTGELGLTANLAATAFVIREAIGSNLPSDRSSDTQVIVGLRVVLLRRRACPLRSDGITGMCNALV